MITEIEAVARQRMAAHHATLELHADTLIQHLETRERRPAHQGREVVVFDIDGTAVNDRWVRGSGDSYPPFVPIRKAYFRALELGYHIVFLTGRPDWTRTATEQTLRKAGYDRWHALVMYPSGQRQTISLMQPWKDSERRRLKEERDGFHLVACIGDQDMDVKGEHIGELQIRLPEPPFDYYISL